LNRRVTSFITICAVLAGAAACSSGGDAGSAGAGGAGGARGGRGGRGAGGGAVPAVVAQVMQRDVPVDIAAIGNVEAFSTISVRAQVSGIITDVLVDEGSFVKAGDHLLTIDQRPYQAALEQAQANLKRDEALLNQAQAQLARDVANADYAKGVSARQIQLAERGIISKDQLDQSNASANATGALVNADKAAVESAKAQLVAQQALVDNARLQMNYTEIRSPINGRTGSLTVKKGNLANANSAELMTITQIEPVYVTFSMPATHLPDIKRHFAQGELAVTATPQDVESKPIEGKLAFVDNAVDAATDTIKLKARFENTDHALWPGQFARVSLRLATLPNATVVPSQAVQTGQDGQFVFVVKADSTVEQRPVVTGQAAGNDTVINQGLKPGETVVTEGQLRLEAGSRITRADPKTGEAAPAAAGARGGRGGRGQAGQTGQGGGGGQRSGGGQADGGQASRGGQNAPQDGGQVAAGEGRRGGGRADAAAAPGGSSDQPQGGRRGGRRGQQQ
jgi:membrane fusion protein, multidrug efflux system